MPRFIDYLENISTNAIVWNDINIDVTSAAVGANAPDLVAILGGGIYARGFDGQATMEQVFAAQELLHDYNEGTDIRPHVHWMATTTSTGSVEWNMEYSWQNLEDSDNLFPTASTISVISASTGVKWFTKTAAFGAVDGTSKKIGSHFILRVYRNPASSNDTYADDAVLLGIGLHYQVNSMGSRGIFTK